MKADSQPLLPVYPVAAADYHVAQPRRRQITKRIILLAVAAVLAFSWASHSTMVAMHSSQSCAGFCGPDSTPFSYTPDPGHWDSNENPTHVTLELTGVAVGEVVVSSSADVKIASTSVTFYLSDEDLASDVSVTQEPNDDGRYKLVVETPKRLWGRKCILAEIHLVLPAQQDPKIGLTIVSQNANVVVEDLRKSVLFDTVNVAAENGRVASKGIHAAGAVKLATRNGAISTDGTSAPTLLLESSNGHISASNVDVDAAEGLVVRSSNGAVDVSDLRASSLAVQSRNGKIAVSRSVVKGFALLGTQNGAVSGDIEVHDGNDLEARAEHGAIDLYVGGKFGAVNAVGTTSAVRLYIVDEDFKGSFEARSRMGKVSVTGSDLHFGGGDGGKVKVSRKGWKGDENGPQKVTAKTEFGAVELNFQ